MKFRSVNCLIIISPPLTLFRIWGEGGQKGPATSFSSVTSTNVGISPQNFLTFSFNPFDRLVWNFKFVPSTSPKLLNLNQDHPWKKRFFWPNPYKNWGCDNFSYTNPRVTKLWSHDYIHNIIWVMWQILLVTSQTEYMT